MLVFITSLALTVFTTAGLIMSTFDYGKFYKNLYLMVKQTLKKNLEEKKVIKFGSDNLKLVIFKHVFHSEIVVDQTSILVDRVLLLEEVKNIPLGYLSSAIKSDKNKIRLLSSIDLNYGFNFFNLLNENLTGFFIDKYKGKYSRFYPYTIKLNK